LPPHNKGPFDSRSHLFSGLAIAKKLTGKKNSDMTIMGIRRQMLTISSAVCFELKIKSTTLPATPLFDATSPCLFHFATFFLSFDKTFDLLLLTFRWSRLDILRCGGQN
jgi:hypothetical protein